MAIKLITNYSKRLGLPGYSSHQFSVSVETELLAADDIAGEAERLYQLLQANVDEQIQQTGFVPPADYGMTGGSGSSPGPNGSANGNGNGANGDDRWACSDKQKDLILRLVDEHGLEKAEVNHLARQRFGKGVRQLDKMEASGLIDELIDVHGKRSGSGNGSSNGNGHRARRGSAYATGRNGGAR